MKQYLGALALLVADYDEAIAWYVGKLGFELAEDTDLGGGKRWVLLAPPGAGETRLLLARAANDEQRSRVGNQAGGRVFLFLHTDDFRRDWQRMRAAGVRFREAPAPRALRHRGGVRGLVRQCVGPAGVEEALIRNGRFSRPLLSRPRPVRRSSTAPRRTPPSCRARRR
jgi:catechol 2,3-dioxygenase-like lactoylglutathione lyase family enzyme